MVERHTSSSDQLLDVAARIVETEGFSSLSVRRLATEVNASRQVVYTHFGGMDGLLDALHMRSSDLLAADMLAIREPIGTDENMHAAAHAYVRAARRRPALFDLTFGRPVPHYTASAKASKHGELVFREHIVRITDTWMSHDGSAASSNHTPKQALVLARLFWSSVHGLVTIERAGHASRKETDRLCDLTVTLLLAGWRAT